MQTTVTGGGTQTQATVVRESTTQAGTVTTGTVTSGNGLLLSNMQQNLSSPTRSSQYLLAGYDYNDDDDDDNSNDYADMGNNVVMCVCFDSGSELDELNSDSDCDSEFLRPF